MIEAVNEQGFIATTISDLVARAGISRRSFYEHFQNKEECLLAAYDAIVKRLTRRLIGAVGSRDAAEDWSARLEVFLRELFEAAGDRPDLARLVCVEMGAAGTVGVQRWAATRPRSSASSSTALRVRPGRERERFRTPWPVRSWAHCAGSFTRACAGSARASR